ncbi:hypothetical protein Q4488_02180 [Amphritea sp. 1_MG-2023]|uniref:hypothetical protein n=1 Tax=Amphritea sp. 1_MG-2023 TaxID=3062670 RepID=UPI0026E45781|nr:hypothetical protein [Amphritea sp. 1_MG-2023]MDO6562179.1 hypothetical protein [Amphritea sp. 1_MG-2023]
MRKITQLFLSSALLILSFSSFAGIAPPMTTLTDVEESKDEIFAGLNWELGGSLTPQLVIGFRSVDVKSDGDVEGAGTSISFSLLEKRFDKFKLFGIKGNDDVAGELGVGYGFINQHWLAMLGAQGDYINIGINLTQPAGFGFHGELNTTDFKAPDQKSTPIILNGTP